MERLVFFDSDVLQNVREELYRSECVGELLNIVGLDASPKAVTVAQSSLEAMKVGQARKILHRGCSPAGKIYPGEL
jgi:hypothetical protein